MLRNLVLYLLDRKCLDMSGDGGGLTEIRKVVCVVLCCLFFIPGCSRAQKQVAMVTPAPQPALLQEEKLPVRIASLHAVQRKKVFDYITIDGESYPVPIPWRGRELNVKPLHPSALKQIPLEFSREGSRLYLLESACNALVRMAEKAKEDNVNLVVHSGYRSIWYQRKIFRQLMATGRTWDDLVRYVAPPGYSEHMLGSVVDLYPSNWNFASTPQYKWLKEHASAFGFTETYPEHSKTGFPWEPWHWKFTDPAAMRAGE